MESSYENFKCKDKNVEWSKIYKLAVAVSTQSKAPNVVRLQTE